jgi:hypothetical protein
MLYRCYCTPASQFAQLCTVLSLLDSGRIGQTSKETRALFLRQMPTAAHTVCLG